MKKTNQELITENAELQERLKFADNRDETIRKEFAKAFHWKSQRNQYSDPEIKLPSWQEIFVETGKLISLRDFRDFEGNVSELGEMINRLSSENVQRFIDLYQKNPNLTK